MTGAEQTPQERLAGLLDEAYRYPAWTPPHEIAAAILDSDVIREIKAEAWRAAVASMRYEDGTPVEIVSALNPYRRQP